MAAKFGEPAAMSPKTAVTPRVRLKAHFRPQTSQPKPQKMAPARRPMFWARERRGGRDGENSLVIGTTFEINQLLFSL